MVSVEYSTHLQSCLWTLAWGNKGQMMSGKEWTGWCLGGVWEAFLRVGGRLQMTKICVFCWLLHSNGRMETEGDKGGKQLGSWASLCVARV